MEPEALHFSTESRSMYFTIVHSVLKYACPIWDTHFHRDMDLLEHVQRRAVRLAHGDYWSASNITSMLWSPGWSNFYDQQWNVWVVLLYKTVHGQVPVSVGDIKLTKADSCMRSNHPFKYQYKLIDTTQLKILFTPWHLKWPGGPDHPH